MRIAPPLFAFAAVIVSAAGLLGACGSNVVTNTSGMTTSGSTGGSGTTTSGSTGGAGNAGTTTSTGPSSGDAGGSPGTTVASSSSTSSTSSSSSSSSPSSSSTSSSSSSSSSGAPDGGPTCPSLGDPCTGCLSTMCASQYCSCYGNLACDQLSQCTGMCAAGDDTCLQTCLTAHEDGISPAYLLASCQNQECTQSCPNSGVMLNACQTCLFTQCDTEMDTCLADPECLPLITCWNNCNGSMSCITMCSSTYSAADDDADAVALCSSSSCQGTCP